MDQCLTELFGVGVAARVAQCNGVGRAIVLDHTGVVDRDVGGALLEIADGVASCPHNFANELVSVVRCATRIVHEPGLDGLPATEELLALLTVECSDIEVLDPFFALAKLALRFALIVVL
jgi:hypothetical protein